MDRPEKFRQLAAEADKHAEQARDEFTKNAYRSIARSWRDLADQIERFHKQR